VWQSEQNCGSKEVLEQQIAQARVSISIKSKNPLRIEWFMWPTSHQGPVKVKQWEQVSGDLRTDVLELLSQSGSILQ